MPAFVCTPVGSLPSEPLRGRCSALPDGRLVALATSDTDVTVWAADAADRHSPTRLDLSVGGQALHGAPLPSSVRDVACFSVPPLGTRAPLDCICVGFDTGELRIFRRDCAFLFAMRAHGSPIRRVRVRADCELTVLHENAVVLVDGGSLRGVLYSCAREAAAATAANPWGPASTMPAAERLRWALPSTAGTHSLGTVTDVACCGMPPPGPFEAEPSITDARCLVLAAKGGQACLQTVLASNDDSASSAADVAFEAASALFTSVSSVTRGLFWSRSSGADGAGAAAAEAEAAAARQRAPQCRLASRRPSTAVSTAAALLA
jgi:hypothetical protein